MTELVNTESDCTIGVIETENDVETYRPLICWNLKIESYISEKGSPYRAYGCLVKVKGKRGEVKTFKVFIKEGDFCKFDRVRTAIVAQTHGELILNSRFDHTLWSDLVPKLLFECADTIRHQQPARNIGLQWQYLKTAAFDHGGVPQLEHVEIVYKDIVFNGLGETIACPVNVLVPEAFPNKTFRVSDFKPSGLRGFLKNCLPPYTSTSKYRRDQQVLVIIGAAGQHFYRLIVHNTGSCPSLMLASYEPETQKSTAALVGLKAVSDPKQFYNLQSSAAAVMEQRSTSSLPTVYDDIEGEGGQNKMMVGSMNGASKFTKGDGEEEQLGGTVYTKNLKTGMKMPAKIVEGRNNWLLMEKDSNYEEEENCEQNFDHCNEMANILMPREFLVGLTKYFIREEKEHLSFFQEAQREACEIMAKRRPNWGKRKSKSASLFISIFFLVEKEVADTNDHISKELFVEAFDSRDTYIEILMQALDKVDEVEEAMTEGVAMKIPSWTFDDNGVDDENEPGALTQRQDPFDVNKLVLDTLDVVASLSEVDKTKYIKIFHTHETTIAIQHTKVKNLAKEIGKALPKFLLQKKNYPSFVTLKTETFTKMTATSARGTANTGPGFCTSILLNRLSGEVKQKVAECLGLSNEEALLEESVGDLEGFDDDIEGNPSASQDYPQFSQSQSSETLKVCELCNYTTRSKLEFTGHMQSHPKCQVCKEMFKNEDSLTKHLEIHQTTRCAECGIDVAVSSLSNHVASHELTKNYKAGLTKSTKKSKKEASGPNTEKQPRLNSFHIFCRAFREAKKLMYPTLNMLGINAKLREDWHKLSGEQQAAYKPSAATAEPSAARAEPSAATAEPSAATAEPSAATSEPSTNSVTSSMSVSAVASSAQASHAVSTSASISQTPVALVSTVERGQTTIQTCGDCKRMFFDLTTLNNHKRMMHAPLTINQAEDIPEQIESQSPVNQPESEENYVDIPSVHLSPVNMPPVAVSSVSLAECRMALQWFKHKSVWWPCKLADQLVLGGEAQEMASIIVFDDKNTALECNIAQMKPFSPLDRIPRSRTAEWRRGYEQAMNEYNPTK